MHTTLSTPIQSKKYEDPKNDHEGKISTLEGGNVEDNNCFKGWRHLEASLTPQCSNKTSTKEIKKRTKNAGPKGRAPKNNTLE